MEVTFELVAAFVLGTIAVSRLSRLVVDDDWPPMVRLREWYALRVSDEWVTLVECPFCVSVYFSGLNVAAWTVAYFVDWDWVWWLWWLPQVFLSIAYLAAMLNVRDIPAD